MTEALQKITDSLSRPRIQPEFSFAPDLTPLRVIQPQTARRRLRADGELTQRDVRCALQFSSRVWTHFVFRHCIFRGGLTVRLPEDAASVTLEFENCWFGPELFLDAPIASVTLRGCAAAQLEFGAQPVDSVTIDASTRAYKPSSYKVPCLFRRMVFGGPIPQRLRIACRAENVVFGKDFTHPPIDDAHVQWDVHWLRSIDISAASAAWQAFLRERHPSLLSDLSL